VEGGARGSSLERDRCRDAFRKFFPSVPRLKGKPPRTVSCGGRKAAYDAFATAVRNPKPGVLSLLLVDSEAGVAPGRTVWQHLKSRPGDEWDKPEGAADDQAFLMVQVMETWFIADREAMERFFGANFRSGAIPAWPKLEEVPKQAIYEAIEKATADCGPRKYATGRLSFDLLATVSPAKVEDASPHAKELFERLRNRQGNPRLP
jgi:hypothetical protein